MEKNVKHDCFSLLYYEENQNLLNACLDWCNSNNHAYFGIKHDNCFYTETTFDDKLNVIGYCGSKKQLHYHLFIKLNYPIYDSDFIKKIGYEKRFVKSFKPKNLDNKILYLTHINCDNKTVYPIENIFTNRLDYVNYVYSNYNNIDIEYDFFYLLEKYIKSVNKPSYTDFLYYMRSNNVSNDKLKKYWAIAKDIIYENHRFKKQIINSKDDIKKFDSILSKFPNLKVEQVTLDEIYFNSRKEKEK